jgi:DNA-binding MarR family transcriptional regulator
VLFTMIEEQMSRCLFVAVNRFSRTITKMAEEEFASIHLSPTYAFLLMIIAEKPGLSLKECCEKLHIAPSTGTRFIDKLIAKGLVERKAVGKLALMYPTEKGFALVEPIRECWKNLYTRYSTLLGVDEGCQLAERLMIANAKLEQENN